MQSMTTRLTSYQTLVQSAACHPNWDAKDHAMYLWSEYFMFGAPDSRFDALHDWCQMWLDTDRLANDVRQVLAYADAWNNA